MNQFVAILRRVAVVSAALVLSLSILTVPSRAQSGSAPADSTAAPADSAAAPADSAAVKPAPEQGKKAKQARTAKAPKVAKSATAAEAAPAKKEKAAKAPRVAKAKVPEKSLEEQKKEDGIYAKGTNWIDLKFGYAKRTGDLNGDGLVGYGVGYQHMMSRTYAFAADVGHDIVGHFGQQLDIAVPFTAEFQRHYNWNTAVRPYVGLGGGYYYRKNYRTGTDYNTTTTGGPHVSLGFSSQLDARHVIGFDVRWARLLSRKGIVNPTFGPSQDSETIWTAKVRWGLAY